MKTLKTLIACICLMSFLGCDNNDIAPSNMDVDRYVELLRKGKYEPYELPDFTYKDIPALLAYRNENQQITNYPINSISSLWLSECSLGMYVLWTIESIRARAIDSEYLIGTFPSQNPIVEKRDNPSAIERGNEVQELIAKSYQDWWNNNKNKDFDKFKEIDPLVNTEYRWH
ncbi:DUF4943 family protein [Algoriphagus sp. D3-2-R+10]|uniref:DUF4943 family protein n=1 Tax=Algoriphagus aurantiacus TaxID=3103948 RepID=UPI002B3DEADE|nr:DUF4943 family protein [Algoriphagus sp. D3-2-R+10]MEB2777831.1 DUF4943 family protein [Algoriphagus sp. D3-2-R+10]